MPANVLPADRSPARLSRRAFAGTAAAGAALAVIPTLAQEASPSAAIDFEAFRQVNLAVTGADDLDDEGLRQLLDLFLADEEMTAALATLMDEVAAGTELDLRSLDFSLVVVTTNIKQFWYLGNFRNEPLPNRPQRIGRLVTYAALPYFTVPTICKAFGYWATDPGL